MEDDGSMEKFKNLHAMVSHSKSDIPPWVLTMPEECIYSSMMCEFSGGGIASRSTLNTLYIVTLVQKHRTTEVSIPDFDLFVYLRYIHQALGTNWFIPKGVIDSPRAELLNQWRDVLHSATHSVDLSCATAMAHRIPSRGFHKWGGSPKCLVYNGRSH